MTGIKFLVDGKGERTAVQIDLKKHGHFSEDFCDALVAKERAHESTESLEVVRRRLVKAGKLRE